MKTQTQTADQFGRQVKRGRNLKAESLRYLGLIYAYWNILDRKGEVWKSIPDYEGFYEVSNLGRVKSVARTIPRAEGHGDLNLRQRILRPGIEGKGYLNVGLVRNSEAKHFSIHVLVARAFIPNPNQKGTVNHKNGVKVDNRAENLEWATRSENVQHAHDHGLMPDIRGERNGSAMLTTEAVLEMRRRAAQERTTTKQLASDFGVSTSCVRRILDRDTWTNV